jgi:hypothetical protein
MHHDLGSADICQEETWISLKQSDKLGILDSYRPVNLEKSHALVTYMVNYKFYLFLEMHFRMQVPHSRTEKIFCSAALSYSLLLFPS